MGVATAAKSEKRYTLIEEACHRNTAAELHFDGGDGELAVARVRLLGLDQQQVFTDRPQSVGKPVAIHSHQVLSVYFVLGGTRYGFRSRVIRSQCMVRLNANHQVVGMAVAFPSEVREQQRRADFRLSLAGHGTMIAEVHQGARETGGSAPIDAQRFIARLLNISAGGVGLLVDAQEARGWHPGDMFFISFQLPDEESEFQMMTELRHHRPIHDGLSTVAGFQFVPWPIVPMQTHVRQIGRFIAAEQRRQLRRGR